MSDAAVSTARTVVLARLTLPVTTIALSAVLACYDDECRRLGYNMPSIVGAGSEHYEPGYITITTTEAK